MHEDIKIQEIKGKIISSLLKTEDSDFERDVSKNKAVSVNSSDLAGSIKEKVIGFGLKNKEMLKNIPGVGAFSKRLYHSILWDESESNGFSVVNTAQISLLKKAKLFYMKIPVLGFLSWWMYMFLKMPSKINILFAEIDELKSTNVIRVKGAANLNSEIRSLKKRCKTLENKTNELMLENDKLRIVIFDGLQPEIIKLKEPDVRKVILE